MFYLYMLDDAQPRLQPDTANQYISHLVYALKYFQLVPPDAVIRTNPTHQLHQAYHRDFKEHVHDRDTCTIPMTFPLLCEVVRAALRMYTGLLHSSVPAALGVAFACSLRPGEYLKQSGHIDKSKLLTAKETYGWYNSVAYRADQMSDWPQGYPDLFTLSAPSRKCKPGRSGPRVIYPNPDRQHFLCVVRLLTNYLRLAHLKHTDPLFLDAEGHCLDNALVLPPIATVARQHGLDPSRMTLQCLRYGVNVQLPEDTPEFVRLNQGGWSSGQGARHYWHQLMTHGQAVQPSVYDTKTIPTELIENLYSRHTPFGPPLKKGRADYA